jgi:hypothetical protein
MKNGAQITTNTATPKYHSDVPPTIIAASSPRPATGRAPHFIIRAARIALLILGRSSGSGRTGRMVMPPNVPDQRPGAADPQLSTRASWPGSLHLACSARPNQTGQLSNLVRVRAHILPLRQSMDKLGDRLSLCWLKRSKKILSTIVLNITDHRHYHMWVRDQCCQEIRKEKKPRFVSQECEVRNSALKQKGSILAVFDMAHEIRAVQ